VNGSYISVPFMYLNCFFFLCVKLCPFNTKFLQSTDFLITCVCVCVCVCIYIYTHAHAPTHARTHTHPHPPNYTGYSLMLGTAVAQWLRCCATIRKVAGSIPAGVSGFFIEIKSFRSHYGPGVDSTSNRNEYQEYFLGVMATGA